VKERDAQGQPLRMLGTHTDITAVKQAQAAQAESEARLKYLLGRAPTVIYTARAEGDYGATFYSPNIADMLGWRPEQFLQDAAFWLDHVHPQDRPEVLARMGELEERGSVLLEYRFQHADGRWRWMRDEVGVERGPDGRPIELVGSWIDITERREAEDEVRRLAGDLEQRVIERTEQLTRSEARYRTIFETVPVSIGEEDWSGVQSLLRELRAEGVTDAPGYFATRPDFVQQCLRAVKVQRLNRQALALHDAQDQQAAVKSLESFYPRPEDLPQFIGELEAMWAGQRLFTAKRSLPSVTGRPLRLMLTMSLPGLDDDDGTALVCLVDITEIDRLNAELDSSVARLRQANSELETFTYSVSHDLKAPLRGIDGYSRLLLTDHSEQLDDEGRKFLAHIRQATKHMGMLIDDLLSYSRLERREVTLARQPLATAVEVVLSGYRTEFAAAGVELEVQVDPALNALADAQGLTLALRNLIDNALKFSRASAPPRISIAAVRRDGGIELSVRDNGVGFDMKFHDRIFSIFQRLHRSEDYPGTGIGLAIVRKAMERMGGRVTAISRPGEGAAFTLRLPESDEI
jgi:PAS domain S-box-containing protein